MELRSNSYTKPICSKVRCRNVLNKNGDKQHDISYHRNTTPIGLVGIQRLLNDVPMKQENNHDDIGKDVP